MIKIDDFNSIYNIKYFTNTDIIKKFYNNDNKENKDPIENNNFNLSYNDLNLAITNCNVIFKKWILDSYTDQKNLQYILYMTTESTNASVIYTDPFNINGKQYCSPSGSGIVSLTDSNIQYISDDKPIIQIFGHNSFGFANSFYEINEKNMLVCLDVSNSFSEKYKSYNYIYIKDDNLTSISNVCLKKSDLSTKCYESISYPSQNSILYHNNNYIQDQDKDLIFLNISNNVTIINSIIKYTNYEKVFLLLNKNFNNEDLSSKLIYNGYIHINNFNDPFFVFSVINGSFKDFYILLFSDIYYIKFYREIKKIFSKGDERSKNYNDSTKEMFNTFDTLTNEIRENYEMLNKQSVVNSYRLKKYLKYKNKYLKLRK